MTDYQQGVTNGTMMIRDVGNNWVEFWFQTSSSTYNNDQLWGYQANGQYVEQKVRIARGGGWQNLGSVYVTDRQNVMFRIFAAGLGWGTTDFNVFIERARVPDPPTPPSFSLVTSTSVAAFFNDGYNGGMAVDAREMWISTGGSPSSGVPLNSYTWPGLIPGVQYNFWGRVHNPIGWSAFSAPSSVLTHRVPDPPSPVALSNVRQTAVLTKFNGNWDGGEPIQQWQLGYGKDPTAPTSLVTSNGTLDLGNLEPGQHYYFWARGRNAIGWGGWSARSDVLLVAGAWVPVAGTQHRAVCWIKVNGVWKLASPWQNSDGTWRTASS